MILSEVVNLLEASVLACSEELSRDFVSACGADLMSDVLAFSKEKALLLTGLVNPQAVRTAEMMDMKAIVFVRGKSPTAEMIELAEEKGIALLSTKQPMFCSCGILYKNGLIGAEVN